MGLDNAAVSRLRLTWEVRRPLLTFSSTFHCPGPGDLGILGAPQCGLPGLLPACGEYLCHLESGPLFWQLQSQGTQLGSRLCAN